MSTEQQNTPAKVVTVRGIFEGETAKKKFHELLGQKAQGFITSVLQIVSSNNDLAQADPMTVYYAAATAATMDLPINQNLGFAWIIAYNNGGKKEAQFQMGYKGYNQLALRTGQYLRLNAIEVFENQFKSWNALTETLEADFSIDGEGEVVGYCSYFKLVNGFEKTTYWTKKKVTAHAAKFSKSWGQKWSTWTKDFDAMAKKTVLKNSLAKWGILSIEMQRALVVDQAVVYNDDGTELAYVDQTDESDDAKAKADKITKQTEDKLNKSKNPAQQMEADLGGGAGK